MVEREELMSNYDVTLLHNVAVDGLAKIVEDKLNKLSPEEFKVWVNYQFSICEGEDI
jgi:hypothetical protein